MNDDQVKKILTHKKWRFAKTMPWIPHSYSRRNEWEDSKEFEAVVQYIRDNGVKEKFGKRTFTYFYIDEYKYWTMGNPLPKTILINRAKHEN